MTRQKQIQEILDGLASTDMFNGAYSWGSCQYETAAATYASFEKLKELYGFDDALTIMGVKIHGQHRAMADAVSLIIQDSIQSLEENRKEDPESWEDFDQEALDTLQSGKLTTVDDLLNFLRDSSWDLWGAAPYIAGGCIKGNIEFSSQIGLQTAGPLLNQMAQGENYKTGIYCAILNHFYNATEFEGFDT